jgi:hypothetical protein
MGDSLAIDDEDFGWTHHFAYKIAVEKMPFDVVNLAKSGSSIAPAAHTLMENSENNCYRKNFPPGSNTWISLPSLYMEEVAGYKHRWELAATTGADYLVLQMGANDLAPYCIRSFCNEGPKKDKTLDGKPFGSCFWEGLQNEDE